MINNSIRHASKNRQRVLNIGREINTSLNSIIKAKRLTKGTICNKIRKCGNPHCKCAHGKPHMSKILSLSCEGRSKVVHLGKYSVLERAQIYKHVRAYQRFRLVRAYLANNLKLLMAAINTLEHNLLIEIVPLKGTQRGTKEKKA
jgi:hypothetical protein